MNQITTGIRRARRNDVLAAIKSGQYTVEIAGVVTTDFQKIEELFGKWPEPRTSAKTKALGNSGSQLNRLIERDGLTCRSCHRMTDPNLEPTDALFPARHKVISKKDGGKAVMHNLVLYCNECHRKPDAKQHLNNQKPVGAQHPAVKVDGSTHLIAQYEHFGDAIVLIAARVLSHEVHGKNKRAYMPWISELVSNKNLATYPGIRHADQFEVIIGQEFVLSGIEPAFDTAKQMLCETKAYLDTSKETRRPAITGDGEKE